MTGNREVAIYRTELLKLCNFVIPSACTLCNGYLSVNEQSICAECALELPWLTSQCQRCATPLADTAICPECQQRPPNYRRCIAPLQYQYPVNKLIKPLKTDSNAPEFIQLSRYLTNAVNDHYGHNDRPKVLLPVPLHWRTLIRRGYNQSYIIAKQLSAMLEQTSIANNILYRRRYSQPQHLQTKQDRTRSMLHVFDTKHRYSIKGRKLALIDDVVTTGATAQNAALCLLKAGAESVDIWCIARTGWHNRAI